MSKEIGLPEMPEGKEVEYGSPGYMEAEFPGPVFTADQMRDYALKAQAMVSPAIANKAAEEGGLPALPHTTYNGYSDGSEPLWTKEQMHGYATQAIAADRASRQVANKAEVEPVAWMDPNAGFVRDAFLWQQDGSNPQYSVPVFATPPATTGASTAPRPTDDDLWDATLRDRDAYHEWADKLADAIASYFGVDIGEHSNQNCPWHEALEAIESAEPDRRAQPEGEAPQAVAWVYECRQPGDDKDNWAEFFSRNKPSDEPYIRNTRPLYDSAATLSPLCGAQHADSGAQAANPEFDKACGAFYCENKRLPNPVELYEMGKVAAQSQGARCMTCDGTGMVHRADGEYLGECTCEAGTSAPGTPEAPADIALASRPAEVDDEGLPGLPKETAWMVPVSGLYEYYATKHAAKEERAQYEASIGNDVDHEEPEALFTAKQYRQGQRDAVAADRARREKLPANAAEMVAFIGSHYNSMRDDKPDPNDIVYELTVHDLLSAFRWWFDDYALEDEPSHTTNKEK